MDKTILEIPIYRCSPDHYEKERQLYKKKSLKFFYNCNKELFDKKRIERIERQVNEDLMREYSPWKYNEIIGYIKIFVFDNQIRGDLWFVDKKRITRKIKKRFILTKNSLFTLRIIVYKTNKEIFFRINKLLIEIQNRKILKNRFVDLEVFQKLGPFIEWKKMIKIETRNM